MQATQGSSVVWQGSQVVIMSHLKPFSPAMACERQPLSKLPLEARAMIEAFCQLPPKTPTAKLIDAEMQEHWDIACRWGKVSVHDRAAFLEEIVASGVWKPQESALLWRVSKDKGFAKYLRNSFVRSPGSVWLTCYTHRKLGHRLFCNGHLGNWGSRAGLDRDGNSIKYPGWE